MPRFNRTAVVFIHDVVMAAVSFVLSLYLRLGDAVFSYASDFLLPGTAAFALVAAITFRAMGLYRGVWRYASLNDLLAIARSATLTILVFLSLMFLWTRLEDLPRSILIINWFVLMALLGGPRFLYRILKDRQFEWRLQSDASGRIPVLLAGYGDTAELFVRALGRSPDAPYRLVGIVTQRPERVGQSFHGVEVLGTLDALPQVIERLSGRGDRPQRLILSRDDYDGERVRRLLDLAESNGMTLARLPRMTELRSGVADKIDVRPLAIEDLLGRPQTPLDRAAMSRLIAARRVLITGAGGSIGGELARQIAELGPAELALLDSSEFNLYAIDLELARSRPGLARRAILGDVRDVGRIARVFADFRPELVFHAAALKHVPLVEANIREGVLTNVIGTRHVADACRRTGTAVMVMVSTDKAVNPTSVMGATKRIAEQYCQALDLARGENDGTRFVTVRFGNVLGSTGSVVPLFQRQLAEGGPLTVTHPDMKRYFMTTREAVELILQASALGDGSAAPAGGIFVLDMGEPVRILDLAHQIIRLAGLRPELDVKIEFIGPRPGEKLNEEPLHGREPLVETTCKGILLARPRAADLGALRGGLDDLERVATAADIDGTLAAIRRMVTDYEPWQSAANP